MGALHFTSRTVRLAWTLRRELWGSLRGLSRRVSISRPAAPGRLFPQLPQDVPQLREDQLGHRQIHRLAAARHRENRLAFGDPGDRAAEHRGGADLVPGERAEQLA